MSDLKKLSTTYALSPNTEGERSNKADNFRDHQNEQDLELILPLQVNESSGHSLIYRFSPYFLELIDIYFSYCHNQPYSFFHEGKLRRQIAANEVPEHLIFAIAATAVRFSKNPLFEGRHRDVAINYADRSWSYIVSDCFATNQRLDIRTVQTITLLSIFDFTGKLYSFMLCKTAY